MAAVDPAYFRTEASADLLYRALISGEQVDAVYVSFEDGYHRVVTRMDEDRRRSDPKIPANANWHSSYIDDFSVGKDRARHRLFFETWGHSVGGYSVPSNLDIRVLDGYAEARSTRGLVITEPTINPDTGAPILSVRYPIIRNGEFIGAASANITMDVLSRYLASHRASPNSTSIIADVNSGKIIAAADRDHGVQMINGKLTVATIDGIRDPNLKKADLTRTLTSKRQFPVRISGQWRGDQRGLHQISGRFRKALGGHRPDADQRFHRRSEGYQPADGACDHRIDAGRIAADLCAIDEALAADREYLARAEIGRGAFIREAFGQCLENQGDRAAAIGGGSVAQFAAIVLIVRAARRGARTGQDRNAADARRRAAIHDRDVHRYRGFLFAFGDNCRRTNLLDQMSVYFEQVSRAITQETGTVDKFIGDGVMAFWGAPAERRDHALRACAAALRATRRMTEVNEQWAGEGRPTLRVRIGLHSADVLVGNVGSTERLSYTVMGDGVNVAARLEGMNKVFGTAICVSDSVVKAAGSALVVRPLREVQVKGRMHEFMAYELLGIEGDDDPEVAVREADARLGRMTWDAWRHLERGDLAQASSGYRAILDDFPGDPIAKSQLESCETSQFGRPG